MRVAVVPAFNEEAAISATVTALTSLPTVDRVVVVDDGSSDCTAARAAASGALVVAYGSNLGKGGALNRALSEIDFDTLLLADADLGETASQAGALLDAVISGECDLAVAAFPPAGLKGGFGIAQGAARAVIRALTGRVMVSPMSGQRAMSRKAFAEVFPFEAGFGMEVGMTLDALHAGLSVEEVPLSMTHSETARDFRGFIHRGKQLAHLLRAGLKRLGRKR